MEHEHPKTPLRRRIGSGGSIEEIVRASDMARHLDRLLAEGPDLAIALAAAGVLLCLPLIRRALRR